jgi:hypothetical protein
MEDKRSSSDIDVIANTICSLFDAVKFSAVCGIEDERDLCPPTTVLLFKHSEGGHLPLALTEASNFEGQFYADLIQLYYSQYKKRGCELFAVFTSSRVEMGRFIGPTPPPIGQIENHLFKAIAVRVDLANKTDVLYIPFEKKDGKFVFEEIANATGGYVFANLPNQIFPRDI